MFMMSPSSGDIIELLASSRLPIEVRKSVNEVLSTLPSGRLCIYIALC
jgi:hypothetical protein